MSGDQRPLESSKTLDPAQVSNGTVQDDSSNKAKPDFSSYWRIFTFTDRTGWLLNGVAFVTALASGTLLPLMNLIFGKAVSSFTDFGSGSLSPAEFRAEATKWSLWFIYLFVARFCLTYIWTVSLNISALRTTKIMRTTFLRQALRQDIAYYDQVTNGAIAVQVVTNGNLVNVGIAEKLGLIVQGLATFVAAFAVAFSVQWKLTLIVLSIVPAMLIFLAICITILIRFEAVALDYYSQAGAFAEDVFSSIRAVHAFGAQETLAAKYNEHLLAAKCKGLKLKSVLGLLFSNQFFCVTCGYALAFWQGSHMYANGQISSSGSVVTVVFAVILAAVSITQVAPQFINITKAASAAHELFRIIDREPKIDSMSPAGMTPESFKGDIQLSDLVFRYPSRSDTNVLQRLNLRLPRGKTTALVGPSGSGKSTIVGLLLRWYDPLEGTITMDGHNLRDFNLQWLRTHVRAVQQEPVLFNATVFENVAYGLIGTAHAKASRQTQMKLVQAACKESFAHDFIMRLPQGYDTPLGERGGKLSGGQKQRLAIARSVVADPQILLLDEATSALDPNAEKIVQEALDNVARTRTTLVIAHRLSTVKKADHIAVVSQGTIVEQGNHEQLMMMPNGLYADLVQAQDLNHSNKPTQHLGQGSDENKPEDSTTTNDSSIANIEATLATTQFNYSLFTCLLKLGKQQPHLYPWFALVFVISLLGGGIQPCTAVLFARAINVFELDKGQIIQQGNFWALMLFVLAIAVGIIYFTDGWSANVISQETTHFYRLQLFKDVIRQDIDFFDDETNTTGALVSRLSSLPTDLQELIGFNASLIIIITTTIIASCALAIGTGWKLGLTISLSALPVMVLFGYIRIRLESKLEAGAGEKFSSSAALASEAVSAMRTVSSLAMEANVLERYEARLENIVTNSVKGYLWTMIWFSLSQSVNFLAMALGFWYGSRLLSTGEYDTTQFFTVFLCVVFSGEGTAQFFSYTTSFTKAQRAANYLLWLHSIDPKMASRQNDMVSSEKDLSSQGAATVEFDDVSFAYPRAIQQKVIGDVSLTIQPGQNVAFVGASGCGKTTLLALLERFYDPISGEISFQSRPITTLDPAVYRSKIAIVQQEPTLYSGTIRENISLGRSPSSADAATKGTCPDDDVLESCRKAQILEFITSLPEGLDTRVGSRGAQLSGGQRQRVALARALIRRPGLLLLDEATSALDTTTERAVQAALTQGYDSSEGRLGQSCTTVAVAHRLSTIRHCDRIFVFDKGRCVESGTHDELLGKQGYYHRLCQGQSLDRG